MSGSDVQEKHWQSGPLPWQRGLFDQLDAQHRLARLPHALLLSGPASIGKVWFAEAVLAGLMCSERKGLSACGRCDGCQQAMAGSHGDLRWVRILTEREKKSIGIDQVRDAIDFVQKTAAYGAYKVLVIAPAEAMTTAAANALLKTLEEPSAQTLLLLVSHQPWLLPITVRSRCQQMVLPAPDNERQCSWLVDAGLSMQEAENLTQLVPGKPLAALSLTDEALRRDFEQLNTIWEGVLNGAHGAEATIESLRKVELKEALVSLQGLVERRVRVMSATSLQNEGRATLLLHRIVSRLLNRLNAGVTPARDVVVANVCRAAQAAVAMPPDHNSLESLADVLGIPSGRR
ncbi:MAG: DNA polymerase III subunit delta' [Halieaceae bacterium]|jgi:DNA polymerase-3 subunit delta'|nr:DNA polymerase III subunit delta' [Halieaceae bacterium]